MDIAGATSSAYTLTSADARFKVRVLVTATNSIGSTQVASAQVGPIAPSPSQLKALLLGVAALHGPDARISVLLKRGGHTVVFRTFGAGHAALAWYYLPRGATLTKRNSGRHPVLIARGTANFTRTTVVKLKLTLTSAGKRMLEKSHGFTLTCHGTYTPVGYPTATVSKTLKLTR